MEIKKSSEWGMKIPSKKFTKHSPTGIVIHNMGTGSPLYKSWEKNGSISCLKSIEKHHVSTNKWDAIGYHLIIMPDGTIWEGRPLDVVGAHVAGKNTTRIGVLVYGSFDVEQPTLEQIQSLKDVLIYLKNIYPIKKILTHKELASTKCPGSELQKVVDILRNSNVLEVTLPKEELIVSPVEKEPILKSDIEFNLKVAALGEAIDKLKEMYDDIRSVLRP